MIDTDHLPNWLQYLYEARPSQKKTVTALTMAIFLEATAGYDPEILLRAAKDQVANSDWWPTPSEFLRLVKRHSLYQTIKEETDAR